MKSMGKQAKRAMSFVQLVRERFQANGKHALDAVPELDEEKVLKANLEYLTANLGLDSDGLVVSGVSSCASTSNKLMKQVKVSVKYVDFITSQISDSSTSDDVKVKETVCPLEPMIVFQAPKPSVSLKAVNPILGSGLFSVHRLPIRDGDTAGQVASRLLEICRLTMTAAESEQKL